MKHVVAAVCLVLLVSACGKAGTTLYTKAATSACFAKAGVNVKPVTGTSDFVANSATGGAFQVVLAGNRVTVSFGATLEDADNLEQAYRRFRSSNVGIEDVLRRQNNAVMLWHIHPQDADLAIVTRCLER